MADQLKTGYVSASSGNIITPAFRGDWIFVLNPNKPKELGKEPYFSIDMVFPADADLAILKKAASDALSVKFGARMNDPDFVAKLQIPFKDQGTKKDKDGVLRAGYTPGLKVITSTAKMAFRPGVVDVQNNPIIEERQLYSGCWFVASVSPYAYDNKTKGVSFGLRHVMKLREPLETEPAIGGGNFRPEPSKDFVGFADAGQPAATGAASIFD